MLLASLRWLDRSSQAELAKRTGCDEMTVSAVVRTIAAKGWVDRQNDNHDRRATLLRITQLGAALADKAAPLEEFDRQFFIDRMGNRKDSLLKNLDRRRSPGELLDVDVSDPAKARLRAGS